MFPRLVFMLASLTLLLAGCAHSPSYAPLEQSGLGAPASPSQQSNEGGSDGRDDHGRPALGRMSIQNDPNAAVDGDGPYLVDTGDELRIFVYGHPNLSRLYKVDHDGKVAIPLIGNVATRGLTTYGLERKVRHLLGSQYIRDPQVTIDVYRNRPFFILGEVRSPGAFAYVNGMTVEAAVAIAGGYSERANLQKMRVSRRVNGMVEMMDVPPDYTVLPGDTVYVFERFF